MRHVSQPRNSRRTGVAHAAGPPTARPPRLIPRRTRWLIIALVALCVIAARAWDKRRYWTRTNFRTVVAGNVYAGGFEYPLAFSGTVWQHHIRTVLTLLPEGSPDDEEERRIATERGIAFRRVAIPFATPTGARFSGREESVAAQLAAVEEAVAILADPQNQPVFVHCRAGCHRTGAVIAVYRVQHCGWSEEDAQAELANCGGFMGNTVWPARVLHAYCASQSQKRFSAQLHETSTAYNP